MKLTDVSVAGEPIKQSIMVQRLEINFSEETKEFLLKALQAETKTGKWIDVENEPYCECSVCGAYIDNLDDDYAFCPRCGADMRGEEE